MIQDPSNTQFLSQGGSQVHEPHTSASFLTNEGEAVFSLATNVGNILVVKLPPLGIQGIATQHELRLASMMQRLWTGLVPSMIRGGHEASDASLSLCIHPMQNDLLIFSICRDHKIRVWSCVSYECIMVSDVLEHVPDSTDLQSVPARNHMIRKSLTGNDANTLLLAVYLGFEDRSQFCVFQPVLQDGQYSLLSVASVFIHNDNLVDFSLTNTQIWAVFTTTQGETVVKYTSFEDSDAGWKPVVLSSLNTSDVPIPPYQDPAEAYVQFLFHESGFSLQAISKTLNIYQQSVDSRLGSNVLQQAVICAMENEVQKEVGGYELPLEEYYQLQLKCWKKFCSNCSQYQEVISKPAGILVDSNTGLVGLVKRSNLSLLRPSDAMEHLYLSPGNGCTAVDLSGAPLYSDDPLISKDILTIGECVRLVRQNISADMKSGFQYDIFQSESPENIALQIAGGLFVESSADTSQSTQTASQFIQDLQNRIQGLMEPVRVLSSLLGCIDVSEGQPEALSMEEPFLDAGRHLTCSHLFASENSAVILSEILKQSSLLRYQFCRDLLVLLYLMQKMGQRISLNKECISSLQTDLIPKTSTYLLAYHSMYWTCCCQASQPETNTIESSLRQFTALEITESSAISGAQYSDSSSGSLVELFLHGIGGTQLRCALATSGHIGQESNETWNGVILPSIGVLARLVWPISSSFLFCEFLLGKCQFPQLQEYIRLLNGWCDWNASSRQFILGQCYLNSDEPYKAVDCFQLAAHGVANEEFLLDKLIQTDDGDTRALQIIYYLKVLRLLEQFNVPNLVISLAKTALSMADSKNRNIPTLWSKIFKHHLELGHNQEAYVAMTANPDPVRRKDCLRQFIVVLFERCQLQQLCEFPYIDLEDEVVSIVESRARSVDLMLQNYYEFLYAFHVYRGNYRKAGSVMYEYGLRAGREVPGIQGLQKQAKCYLSAINSLHLVDPNYAWIVKPISLEQDPVDIAGMSPKRSYDGEPIEYSKFKKQVKVVELKDLQKEYMLVSARLKLFQFDHTTGLMTGPSLSADETVSLLVQAGLFDTAISICGTFHLSYNNVFDALSSKCIRISPISSDSDAWNWLSANDTSHLHATTEIRARELAWRLLESYLEKLDSSGKDGYHKVVVNKLLSLGVPLPAWIVHSYKRVNAAELLRLYINYDLLEEATYLSVEYIDAVLGKGKEYFGLRTGLQAASTSVWLPYTAMDQLLNALRESETDSHFQNLYHKLNDKLKAYINTVEIVSKDMEDTARRRAKHAIMQ
ncbi:nuclear pore complex protein Nup160-like [Saccoglossus kowalevskii]